VLVEVVFSGKTPVGANQAVVGSIGGISVPAVACSFCDGSSRSSCSPSSCIGTPDHRRCPYGVTVAVVVYQRRVVEVHVCAKPIGSYCEWWIS